MTDTHDTNALFPSSYSIDTTQCVPHPDVKAPCYDEDHLLAVTKIDDKFVNVCCNYKGITIGGDYVVAKVGSESSSLFTKRH
jgi:hypothetical protein